MPIPSPMGNPARAKSDGIYDSKETDSLARPQSIVITEVSGVGRADWTLIETSRVSILKPASGSHLAQYTPWSPDEATATLNECYIAPEGVCYLLAIGKWWVRLPEAVAGAPVAVRMVLLDAVSVQATGLAPEQPTVLPPGSATQLVAAPPAVGSVGVASAELLAADVARKQVYLKNMSTAGSTVSIAFGAAAVLGSGITLSPGEHITLGVTQSQAQIRAIATAAATPVPVQVWT